MDELIHRDTPSPNWNERKLPVSMVVLHYTGMKSAQDALDRLCDPAAEVSAHYLIEEDGTVHRLVAEDKRAWHAGRSYWRGITDVNSASVGIELVNPGHTLGYRPFPEAQMEALIPLLAGIMARHNIAPANVVGHSDVAPVRKIDPGELFEWEVLARYGLALATPSRASACSTRTPAPSSSRWSASAMMWLMAALPSPPSSAASAHASSMASWTARWGAPLRTAARPRCRRGRRLRRRRFPVVSCNKAC
jgi:N-acetyl-anhydromuramyl-L-alanine amidase AmpD